MIFDHSIFSFCYDAPEKTEQEGKRMEFTASRMDTVCFTGHRPEKLTQSEEQVRSALRTGIDRALRWKYTTFITGMAQGVDLWAAEEILSLREEHPEIKCHLTCILLESIFDEKTARVGRLGTGGAGCERGQAFRIRHCSPSKAKPYFRM